MNNSNVFPFLWVRDEPIEKIYREIDAIKNLTDGFIIESRPRRGEISDFGTESWFIRIGKILAYANNLNMRVWILDDKSFPTGFANGAILDKYPKLKAKQIKADIVDFYSDGDPCFLRANLQDGEKLFSAFLLKGNKTVALAGGKDGVFSVKVKKGAYRAVFLIITENCFERAGYIDMLNGASTDVLLKEIYEPYYARFKNYFGNTLVGFFSDEPRFASGVNPYYMKAVDMYSYKVGNVACAFPFSDDLFKTLAAQGFSAEDFISLFLTYKDYPRFRAAYMNAITDLYSANFTQKLARWCEARGVLYSGHIIEDAGVHFNVGCGAGHYFKAMRDAAYAGVDVVLHQLKPFVKYNSVAPIEGGFTDYKFYNFTLPRLASSAFCQSGKAKGAIVELFGAYGWGESVKTMLYLVNHFAVSGVGNFIPHAFSMDSNDKDCPPYFYAEGENPVYEGYKILFGYMQRLGEIVNGGYNAKVAVYYNAESVWSGKPFVSIDEVAKVLAENQIDFDFIDYDNLFAAEKTDDTIKVGKAEYSLLIIPDGYLNGETTELFAGVNVPKIFVKKSGLKGLLESVKTKINIPYRFEKPCKDLRAKTFNNGDILLFNAGAKRITETFYRGGDFYACDFLRKEINGKYTDSAKITLNAGEALVLCKKPPTGLGEEFKGKSIKNITDFSASVKPVGVEYEFTAEVNKNERLVIDFYGELLRVKTDEKAKDFVLSPAVVNFGKIKGKVSVSVCGTLALIKKDVLSVYDKIPSCGIKSIKIYRQEQKC